MMDKRNALRKLLNTKNLSKNRYKTSYLEYLFMIRITKMFLSWGFITVLEEQDGKKTTQFAFVQFRAYT